LLGAVTGSFVDYSCERLERTAENGATYDVGYYLPFHRIGGGTRQRDDGVLGLYGSRLRFGLATFDTMETYLGANPLVHARSFDLATSSGVEGMFSYGGSADSRTERVRLDGNIAGRFYYPSGAEDYFIDTGVRAPDAAEGGLRLLATLDPRDDSMRALKRELLETRPYGGTPSAAALDDLYYYFDGDEHGLPRAKTPSAQGRYVVLVTDGYPDNDYRSYGCDCKAEGNCPDGEDPDRMICPYPTMTETARRLRCGFTDGQCDEGPIDAVYVVGLEIPEHEQAIGNGTTDATRVVLNEAAAAGGTTEARFATDQVTLRDELRKIMDEILARRSAFP
jgi:hypothetical protein